MNISDKYLFSGDNDLENITKALLSKKLSGTSDLVLDYEKRLGKFFNSKHAIATSSGTSAIQTALFSAGVSNGDEVIVPPTCPVMTIFPIIHVGAKPIFCDTCVDNFGLNITDLRCKISPRTKAVIEVPMWGYPTDVIGLREFLGLKGIPLILDLAQAHGTKINERYLSAYGDLSCFSTHDRKILATGEGGFILTDSDRYEIEARSFIQFGNMDGKSFGLNFKLGALQASLGAGRIKFIQNQLNQRKDNARRVADGIKNKKVKEFDIIKGGNPNYYVLLLRLSFDDNGRFIDFLSRKGVPSDILRYDYKVLYKYPILEALAVDCRNAEFLSKSITTIPVHPGINIGELDYIISQINAFK
ncbi:MAG: aminotransferase class I/II-fold pyridoxal phosphate-dependent enzyme [Patescibacteria group bacterium]|nr:aminotransferase class I/II-fold pyridoxal phosphate-dependent enzyme [Patescibacteria group bacterium]